MSEEHGAAEEFGMLSLRYVDGVPVLVVSGGAAVPPRIGEFGDGMPTWFDHVSHLGRARFITVGS